MKQLNIALRDGGRAGALAGVLLLVACTSQVSPDHEVAAVAANLDDVESCSAMWFCDGSKLTR